MARPTFRYLKGSVRATYREIIEEQSDSHGLIKLSTLLDFVIEIQTLKSPLVFKDRNF